MDINARIREGITDSGPAPALAGAPSGNCSRWSPGYRPAPKLGEPRPGWPYLKGSIRRLRNLRCTNLLYFNSGNSSQILKGKETGAGGTLTISCVWRQTHFLHLLPSFTKRWVRTGVNHPQVDTDSPNNGGVKPVFTWSSRFGGKSLRQMIKEIQVVGHIDLF